MSTEINTPNIRPITRSRGFRNSSPPRVLGSETSTDASTDEEDMDASSTTSGTSTLFEEMRDFILPQGDGPPELDTPEANVDVEPRYFRIIFRDRRAIIEQFGDDEMWQAVGEPEQDTYFIGRRINF